MLYISSIYIYLLILVLISINSSQYEGFSIVDRQQQQKSHGLVLQELLPRDGLTGDDSVHNIHRVITILHENIKQWSFVESQLLEPNVNLAMPEILIPLRHLSTSLEILGNILYLNSHLYESKILFERACPLIELIPASIQEPQLAAHCYVTLRDIYQQLFLDQVDSKVPKELGNKQRVIKEAKVTIEGVKDSVDSNIYSEYDDPFIDDIYLESESQYNQVSNQESSYNNRLYGFHADSNIDKIEADFLQSLHIYDAFEDYRQQHELDLPFDIDMRLNELRIPYDHIRDKFPELSHDDLAEVLDGKILAIEQSTGKVVLHPEIDDTIRKFVSLDTEQRKEYLNKTFESKDVDTSLGNSDTMSLDEVNLRLYSLLLGILSEVVTAGTFNDVLEEFDENLIRLGIDRHDVSSDFIDSTLNPSSTSALNRQRMFLVHAIELILQEQMTSNGQATSPLEYLQMFDDMNKPVTSKQLESSLSVYIMMSFLIGVGSIVLFLYVDAQKKKLRGRSRLHKKITFLEALQSLVGIGAMQSDDCDDTLTTGQKVSVFISKLNSSFIVAYNDVLAMLFPASPVAVPDILLDELLLEEKPPVPKRRLKQSKGAASKPQSKSGIAQKTQSNAVQKEIVGNSISSDDIDDDDDDDDSEEYNSEHESSTWMSGNIGSTISNLNDDSLSVSEHSKGSSVSGWIKLESKESRANRSKNTSVTGGSASTLTASAASTNTVSFDDKAKSVTRATFNSHKSVHDKAVSSESAVHSGFRNKTTVVPTAVNPVFGGKTDFGVALFSEVIKKEQIVHSTDTINDKSGSIHTGSAATSALNTESNYVMSSPSSIVSQPLGLPSITPSAHTDIFFGSKPDPLDSIIPSHGLGGLGIGLGLGKHSWDHDLSSQTHPIGNAVNPIGSFGGSKIDFGFGSIHNFTPSNSLLSSLNEDSISYPVSSHPSDASTSSVSSSSVNEFSETFSDLSPHANSFLPSAAPGFAFLPPPSLGINVVFTVYSFVLKHTNTKSVRLVLILNGHVYTYNMKRSLAVETMWSTTVSISKSFDSYSYNYIAEDNDCGIWSETNIPRNVLINDGMLLEREDVFQYATQIKV